jgi:hypothetical protein
MSDIQIKKILVPIDDVIASSKVAEKPTPPGPPME